MRHLLPLAAVVILVGLLCWSLGWESGQRAGYSAGVVAVRTPLIEDGRIRWVETDRDTLASGLIIYEVRDLVWSERVVVLVRDGEPVYAILINR